MQKKKNEKKAPTKIGIYDPWQNEEFDLYRPYIRSLHGTFIFYS